MASELLGSLEKAVDQMSLEVRNGRQKPILEDDVLGYIYKYLTSCWPQPGDVHLKTRVPGMGRKKIDLVVGSVARYDGKRPEVRPELAVEVKYCHRDKNPGERYGVPVGVRRDIDKLTEVKARHPQATCAVVLADESGYLTHRARRRELRQLEDAAGSAGVELVLVDLRPPDMDPPADSRDTKRLRAACVLEREYKGLRHTAEEQVDGSFLLDGKTTCSSLTDAAKRVTGYPNVSGPMWWRMQQSAPTNRGDFVRVFKGRRHWLRERADGTFLLDGKRTCTSLTNAAKKVTGYEYVSGPAWWSDRRG